MMAKTLIAYFSRADENYFGGAMRYVKVGNTEIVCNLMKELIEADSFRIEIWSPGHLPHEGFALLPENRRRMDRRKPA